MRAFFVFALVLLSAHNSISPEYQNNSKNTSERKHTISKTLNKNLNKFVIKEKRIFFAKSDR